MGRLKGQNSHDFVQSCPAPPMNSVRTAGQNGVAQGKAVLY